MGVVKEETYKIPDQLRDACVSFPFVKRLVGEVGEGGTYGETGVCRGLPKARTRTWVGGGSERWVRGKEG